MQQLLLLLAVAANPKPVSALKKIAASCGLRAVAKWNVSDILRKSNGCAILIEDGWELADEGFRIVFGIANPRAVVKKAVADVRQHLGKISNQDTKAFIEEAVACFEYGQLRAAAVFSWVGAMSVMQHHIAKNVLSTFNAEARRRDAKWKDAQTTDDIGRMKERDFLDVIESISMIGKNVKRALLDCLDLRNACGHPNSLQISENRVAAHIDMLVLNVYSKL